MRRFFQAMNTLIVTGGIGSGKSEVCRILERIGYPVYDADERMKALYDSDPQILPALEKALGDSFRDAEGRLDRGKLAGVIFSDPEKLRALEMTVHPYLFRDFRRWADSRSGVAENTVVLESAVYCSSPCGDKPEGRILLVEAPQKLRLERACRRDNAAKETILARMASQSSGDIHPDAVIENDGDLAELEEKVRKVMETIFND